MRELSHLDEATLRVEMRNMINTIGMEGSLQCLFEILRSAEILTEEMILIQKNGKN